MISTFTIPESQVYSSLSDDEATPFPRETDQAFSNECSTYSLNMPAATIGAARPGEKPRLPVGEDLGVGKNIREAVAIVKDWMR